ncbi:ribosomal RNA assembly protein [Pelomyxa schiedti]|nr:ribosomal RNA assembly protein [Pelomyxa schiedti]
MRKLRVTTTAAPTAKDDVTAPTHNDEDDVVDDEEDEDYNDEDDDGDDDDDDMEDDDEEEGEEEKENEDEDEEEDGGGLLPIAPKSAEPLQQQLQQQAQVVVQQLQQSSTTSTSGTPSFPPINAAEILDENDVRKIHVPPNRLAALKTHWLTVIEPLVNHLKLQVRMNTATKSVELKTSPQTEDLGSLQKGADFVHAFILGFDLRDAIALIRLDDLYIDTFEIGDVKSLHGEHLSRAIGRVAGKNGKTKFAIENATRTRIVMADKKIHILGSYSNIKLARDSIVSLILGAPPGKVYARLRSVSGRLNERF